MVIGNQLIARFDVHFNGQQQVAFDIKWFDSADQRLQIEAIVAAETGVTWNDLEGVIPARELARRFQPLFGINDTELLPWLAKSWQVEAKVRLNYSCALWAAGRPKLLITLSSVRAPAVQAIFISSGGKMWQHNRCT